MITEKSILKQYLKDIEHLENKQINFILKNGYDLDNCINYDIEKLSKKELLLKWLFDNFDKNFDNQYLKRNIELNLTLEVLESIFLSNDIQLISFKEYTIIKRWY